MPLALFIAILGYSLWRSQGIYHHDAIAWVSAITLITYFRVGSPAVRERPDRFLWLCLLIFVELGFHDPKVAYLQFPNTSTFLRITSLAAGICAVAVWGVAKTDRFRLLIFLFLLFVFAESSARAIVLWASPHPQIDVFSILTESAKYLLEGKSPYGQTYTNIYAGQGREFGANLPSIPYLPALFLWTVPASLFGDVRLAFLVADLGIAALLFWLGRGAGKNSPFAFLPAMLWLANPVGLFVLEQAWIDTLLLICSLAAIWAATKRRWWVCGLAMGMLLATKQYAIVFALPALVYLERTEGRRLAGRVFAIALGTFLILVAPFLIVDARTFLHSTLGAVGALEPRYDALTLTAWLHRATNTELPNFVPYAVLIAMMGGSLKRLARDPSWSSVCAQTALILTAVFLVSKQAFCNYYTLAWGYAVAALALWSVRPNTRPN